jgi:ligand-binding sensor domain-containing protein
LNRYDGYQIKQYRHDPRNANSLGGDFVWSLLEDSRGGIWTSDAVRFDPQTDTFIRYALPRALSVQGRPVGLQGIVADRAGFIWLGFGGGRNLYRLDPMSGTLLTFNIGGGLPANMDIAVKTMFRDATGILWISASTGLVRFDPSTGAAKHYLLAPANGLPADIPGITQDSAGKLWLATTRSLGNFFDPVTGVLSRVWPARYTAFNSPASAIHARNDGVLLQGTSEGLEIFDSATGRFAVLQHEAADPYSLSGNVVQSIAEDRDGTLWFGTKGRGVSRFSPASLRFGAHPTLVA